MPTETYKLMHVVGLVLLLLGLGTALATARGGKGYKLAMLFHGAGLLLMLVAGFGLQARQHIGFPLWLWVKIGCWLLLAMMPVLVKKGVFSASTALLAAAALAGIAVWMVFYRPF